MPQGVWGSELYDPEGERLGSEAVEYVPTIGFKYREFGHGSGIELKESFFCINQSIV
jgi:hypothetical protein